MAATPTIWAPNLTRPHWAGADANTDIHLEIYTGIVDSRFQYSALFRQLSTQRSVQDRSNTIRLDRINTSKVMGRKSGEALTAQRIPNEKFNIVVDTTLYIRNPLDWQDEWTAPSFLTEMGNNNGYQMAEMFDQAHIIQLIKGRNDKAPDDLKPAFSDGMEIDCAVKMDATSQEELEANALQIINSVKKAIEALIKKKVPLTDMVAVCSPEIYSFVTYDPKTVQVAGTTYNLGTYGPRRVTTIAGIPVIECTEFPAGAITDSPLGPNFNCDADDAACQMVIFSKGTTLITVEAKPLTTDFWIDKENFSNILDAYCMYTVGRRRPDTSVVIKFTAPTP